MKINVLFTIAVLLTAQICFAGGLTPIAGGTHIAYDQSEMVVGNNPAVLSLYEDYYGLRVQVVKPVITYTSGQTSQQSDNDKVFIMPTGAWIKRLSDNTVVEFGISVPYGLGVKVENNKQQLGYDTDTQLMLVALTAGASIDFTEKLSMGLALHINYSDFKYVAPLDVKGEPLPALTNNRGNGGGVNATLGWLYKATDSLSLGVMYTTECPVDLDGDTKISLGPFRVEDNFSSKFIFPERFAGGISWKASDYWRLNLDVNYYRYSVDKEMNLNLEKLRITKRTVLNWDNSWSVDASIQHQLNKSTSVTLNAGYMTPAIKETVSTLFVDGYCFTFGAGFEKKFGKLSGGGKVTYAHGEQTHGRFLRPDEKYEADVLIAEFGIRW